MEQIGYALIDAQGFELQSWGDQIGLCPGIPAPLVLPNGDQVCGVAPGATFDGGVKFVARYGTHGATPGVSFDGERVVVVKPLADLKAKLTARVKSDAARLRDSVRTPGKDMVYAEKKDQAHAVIAMGETAANALANNGAAQFPLLAGTVGIEAPPWHQIGTGQWRYEVARAAGRDFLVVGTGVSWAGSAGAVDEVVHQRAGKPLTVE